MRTIRNEQQTAIHNLTKKNMKNQNMYMYALYCSLLLHSK